MVKAVLFDLDGLLMDSETVSFHVYESILQEHGHTFDLETYVNQYSGKVEIDNCNRLIETYRLPYSAQELMETVVNREMAFMTRGVDLKPGAKDLLGWLKTHGILTALATSSLEFRALSMLEQHGLGDAFDTAVFGPEVERGKPYPDIFLAACKKLCCKPEDCLVLEDSENGIKAARAANIPVICIPDMKQPGTAADEICSSLYDVIPLLERQYGCPHRQSKQGSQG